MKKALSIVAVMALACSTILWFCKNGGNMPYKYVHKPLRAGKMPDEKKHGSSGTVWMLFLCHEERTWHWKNMCCGVR